MAGVAPSALLVIAGGLAGCFSPSYERPTCVVDGLCPDDLTCEAGQCVATPLCEPTEDLVLCMSFNDGRAVNPAAGRSPTWCAASRRRTRRPARSGPRRGSTATR